MDSLSYQKLGMSGTSDTCKVTYNKAGLISELGKAPSGAKSDDFQKLMDKAASGAGRDTRAEDAPKSEAPAAKSKAEAPAEKEDALTRIKKMLEQNGNAAAFKPDWTWEKIDLNTGETIATYNPGEWVMVFTGEGVENIPITDLEPWQQVQLDQLLLNPNPIDVSDPEVDAMLKATAPGADNSPAAMLDRMVTDQFGKVVEQAVQPQEDDGDGEVKLIDVEQAPQQLFHDVEAAPVKVGEVYDTQQTEEPDVAGQIDAQMVKALETGESLVRVQLNPENLGEVTVEISQSAEGVLRVALTAHSSETRGLLERHAADLQGLLSSRTQQSVEVNVQRGQESQQNQQQQNYEGHNGHAQDSREERRQQRQEHSASSQDFMQQLRLGLIPGSGEE